MPAEGECHASQRSLERRICGELEIRPEFLRQLKIEEFNALYCIDPPRYMDVKDLESRSNVTWGVTADSRAA